MFKAAINDFDVVIVGSGIAGASLACALGGSSLRVALIEGQSLPGEWPACDHHIDGYDPRVSALTLESQNFLDQLGAWSAIANSRISPYKHMHVWDAEGTASISFDASEIQQSALGHIVENRITLAALLSQLAQHSNVSVISPVKLERLSRLSGDQSYYYQLNLDNAQTIRARLVVAADGANSLIRRLGDFQTREWDYDHQAIVATVETERPHQSTAWQRFLLTGPLAFLPLAPQGDTSAPYLNSIVWSAQTDYSEELMAMSDEQFCLVLSEALECRLGAIKQVSRRFAFPLRQRHALDYVKPGLALVADAAHTIHPLAGQGINLGLQDVKVLAQELLRAREREQDIGDLLVLSRYQRRRKGDNLAMMVAMEGFKRLFSQSALPLRWLRNAGMHQLDQMPLIKQQIMKQAMGLSTSVKH